jgi:tetratricopeptide (TPR) repeat protein
MRAHRFNENALYAWRDETGKPWCEGFGSPYDWLAQAIRLDPGQPDYYVDRGELYLNDLFFNGAIENFKQAIKLDPNCAEAYAGLAMAYGWLNDDKNERANAEIACRLGDCGPKMILDVIDRGRTNPVRGDSGATKSSTISGRKK